MSEASKPTPGVWTFNVGDDKGDWAGYFPVVTSDNGYEVIGREGMYGDRETDIANAALIAEAGTVHHETGLTPRQLLEQRDALLKRLQAATDALSGGLWDYGPGQDEHERCNEVIAECRAAIALVRGVE